MNIRHILGISTFLLGFSAGILSAQATQTQSGGFGGLGNILGGGKTTVSITFNTVIDSNLGARVYSGSVVNGTTINGVSVPQGSTAMAMVQQSGNTWTLKLVSIAASGQSIQITNSTPNLTAGKLTNILNGGGLGGIFGGGNKKGSTQAGPATSASGARVYIPVNTPVGFVGITTSNQQTQPQQQATSNPPASQNPDAKQVGATPQLVGGQNYTQPGAQQSIQAAQPGNSTVVFNNVQYQLTGCHREAPHIVCELQVTNQGAVDALLFGSGRTGFVDQSGNTGHFESARIANCELGQCAMLPGIQMKARYVFMDDTGESRTLHRLNIFSRNEAVAQFSDVPVQ